MATHTPNLNLKKPDGTDYVLVGDINDNSDILDTKIGKLSELTTSEKTNLVAAINEANDSGSNAPYIGENGNWFEWDSATHQYVDSGRPATGPTGEAAGFGTPTGGASALPSGSTPSVVVTASGDNTGKVFDFQFGIPAGPQGRQGEPGVGEQGEPGVSPTVTVSKVGKVSTITITDVDGPHVVTVNDGADGSGTGDMLKATYDTDANGVVDDSEKLGGKLPAYYAKASDLADKVDKVDGKGLSENDYTSAEKTKLSGIEAGANAYEHPETHPSAMITGLSRVATSGEYTDLSGRPTIPTVDAALTSGSVNAAQSGAVFAALAGKQGKVTASTIDLTAGTSTLATGEVYLVYE